MRYKLVILFLFYLPAILTGTCYAQQLKLILPIGHTEKINEAKFSPDGKKIITASKDKTAKIWDVSTGMLIADLKGHTTPVLHAGFSPDGTKAISISSDIFGMGEEKDHVKIWNALSGELIADLEEGFNALFSFSFSPDSKKILTITDSVKLWDATTGKLLTRLRGEPGKAVFSPDGKWIVTADKNFAIIIYDPATGKAVQRFKYNSSAVKDLRFSPDEKTLISLSLNETIILNAFDWKFIRSVPGKITSGADQFNEYAFITTPDGMRIITSEYTNEKTNVAVWDAASRKLLFRKNNGTEQSRIVVASNNRFVTVQGPLPENFLQVSSKNDDTAFLWNIGKGQLVNLMTGHRDDITSACFSPDGKKLVTTSKDGTAKIWDAESGKLLTDLRSHTYNSRAAEFSPVTAGDPNGGKNIVTASDDGSLKFWDPFTGDLKAVFAGDHVNLFSVKYSAGGEKIVAGSQDGAVMVWDTETGKKFVTSESADVRIDPTTEIDMDNVTRLVSPELNPDGTRLLIAIQSGPVKVVDTKSDKLLFQQSNNRYPGVAYAHFSPDGSKLIAGWRYYDNEPDRVDTNSIMMNAMNGKILFKTEATGANFSTDNNKLLVTTIHSPKVIDANTGKFLYNFRCNNCKESFNAFFSPDNKKVFTTSWPDGEGYFWDAQNGSYLYSLKGKGVSGNVKFSPDSRLMITLAENDGINIWNTADGTLRFSLQGHKDDINSFGFSPDSRQVISTSKDNTTILWDAVTGKQLYTFFAIDSADYFVQLPNGYYKCTPDAAKLLHYLTPDLKVISFEQLDVKYNRPDLVLEKIGKADTSFISMYRNAWYKRIKKLGIDTSFFQEGYSVPEADFSNRTSIDPDQVNESLQLRVKAADSTYLLDRFNVWVNEVPVFGQRGRSIRQQNSKTIDKTISIKLSQGENRIETSVTNVNGTESYRMPLIVNYKPAQPEKEKTYFIGIGIDKFLDDKYNLNYSTKDIQDLAAKLKTKFGNDINIDTVFNENVTVANIKAFKQKLLQTTVNDKVIISYSGHGLLSKDYDYYLSTYSVNFKKPEENGLAYDELESLLDSIPARKKLMLIDACHSGEVDKESFRQVQVNKDVMDANHVVAKGTEVTSTDTTAKKVGLANSFELMQNLFVNVGKSTGATIISAAAGTEFALEKGDLKNGVFTYCIMEAMDRFPHMKISELKKIVGARVEQLTNGMQKPTSRNEAIAVDWSVW